MAVNLFDANYYRANNPDLAGFNDAQALQHLLAFGANEGRAFSPYVDLNLYRTSNPDLAGAGLTTNRQLYDHLSAFGAAEGRTFSFAFNPNFYRSGNADLAGLSNEQLFDHFRAFGFNEGRQGSESFSASFYLSANSDLQAAGFNFQQALQHYISNGIAEGRAAAPGGAIVTPSPSPSPQPADPGSTAGTALNLGVLNGTLNLEQFVGLDDRKDYYRFEVATPIEFDLRLDGLAADADVFLYEDINRNSIIDSGERLDTGTRGGTSSESISRNLSPSVYFILVETDSQGRNTDYTLQLVNQTSEVIDVGLLNGPRTFSDFVGTSDRKDYYRFSLNSPSSFNLTLDGLAADANVFLYEDLNNNGIINSGERLDSSSRGGTSIDSISRDLPLGNYFVLVNTEGRNTNYNLELSAISSAPSSNFSQSSDSITLNSDANAADFDALTGINNTSEVPSGADFNTPGFDTPTVSLIEDFSGSNVLDSGGLASNPVSSPSGNLLAAESLAGDPNFADIFPDNGLGNSNLITL
jgi:hypothetical protein